MSVIIPQKLKSGDTICIIAPSCSASVLTDEMKVIATKYFTELGLKLVFSNHIDEANSIDTSSIKSRLEDLHNSFKNTDIKAIIAVRGGYYSNTLLNKINWEIIKNNPKIFCGFSDITALNIAIFAQTNMITYSGPNFVNFGQKQQAEYLIEYFKKCLMSSEEYEIHPSKYYSDDEWWINQNNRGLVSNKGIQVFNEEEIVIEGTILGGNLSTLNLLQGTGYLPKTEDVILFIEDDELVDINLFIRMLQSLLQQNEFTSVKALCIGRFQNKSQINTELLANSINEFILQHPIPILTNLDFGHTNPQFTLPIGGRGRIKLEKGRPSIFLTLH